MRYAPLLSAFGFTFPYKAVMDRSERSHLYDLIGSQAKNRLQISDIHLYHVTSTLLVF